MTLLPFIFWFLSYVLLGSIWFNIDRKFQWVYRWFYGMMHEHGLPPDVEKGFIYGRRTEERIIIAVLLSTLHTGLLFWAIGTNVLDFSDLLIWFSGIPAHLIGFIAGPAVARLWQRKSPILDTVDKFGSGEKKIDFKPAVQAVGNVVGEIVEKGVRSGRQWIDEARRNHSPPHSPSEVRNSSPAPNPPAVSSEEKPVREVPVSEDDDGRDAIRKFTEGN